MKILNNKKIILFIFVSILITIILNQNMNAQVKNGKKLSAGFNSKKNYADSTNKILSKKSDGDKIFGVVNLSVASLRSKPGHSEELATQSLLGASVKIGEKNKNWYYVQTPDNYSAWVESDAIKLMNKEEYNDWLNAEKIIFTSPFGFSYSKSSLNSQTNSDLVKGDIVKLLNVENNFYKVEFPDKRVAFIPVKDCEYFQKWLSNLKVDSQGIIKTAESLLGIPYLWGGTSIKGMDCSGFTKLVFFLNGILLPRDASQQAAVGEFVTNKIDAAKLKPGDLLFFGEKASSGRKEKVVHVGIYIGDGEFIHSSGFVRKNNLLMGKPDFQQQRVNNYLFAKRILSSLDKNGIYLLKNHNYYSKEY
jgi:gamma-D-glutamyl-L-lysine dipeptidyl-peptidase